MDQFLDRKLRNGYDRLAKLGAKIAIAVFFCFAGPERTVIERSGRPAGYFPVRVVFLPGIQIGEQNRAIRGLGLLAGANLFLASVCVCDFDLEQDRMGIIQPLDIGQRLGTEIPTVTDI